MPDDPTFGLFEFPPAGSQTRIAIDAVSSRLADTRRELARQWTALPTEELEWHYVERLGLIHRQVLGAGIREALQSDEDQAYASKLIADLAMMDAARPDPGKVLAAMLFLGPHQLPNILDIPTIPQWLINDYLNYVATPPQMFRDIGEADAYYAFAQRWTQYIHEKVLGNPKNEMWNRVGLFYLQRTNLIPVYFNSANLRELYRKRAQILEFTLSNSGAPVDYTFPARPGRAKIKLGILAAHFAPQTETFATLPVYSHLDRSKFEIHLYTLTTINHPLEKYCAQRADSYNTLPQELPQQIAALRQADLDLIFIATNVTAVTNGITLLAMHRLARVQVASVCSCTTTGMRNIDCYLSGKLSEPDNAQEQYTEKLYMVDGPAHCYEFPVPLPAPQQALSREALGVSPDAVVYASGANFFKIIPEVEETWMKILAATPGSFLLLYPFNPNWSDRYPVAFFLDRMLEAMRKAGIGEERLLVFRPSPTRADVLERLKLADVYLDSFPFAGATSLLDPLEAGLPCVTRDGETFRSLVGPALMRDLEVEELVAGDAGQYVEIATKLGADKEYRARMRGAILQEMKDVPKFFDGAWFGNQVAQQFVRMIGERP
jgi:predicted O-linked N-acetylglucosamine transferase (SPINDLY family)